MVLETFMPCKAATGFPQFDLNNCSNDRLRGKGGITCGLVNKSLVWFDGRIVYAYIVLILFIVHLLQVDSPIFKIAQVVKQIVMQG